MRPDKKKKDHNRGKKQQDRPQESAPPLPPPQPLPPQREPKEDEAPVDPTPAQASEKIVKSTKKVTEKPPKNISSNWTKFEIPSDDELDETNDMTGINFNYMMENAASSSSHLRLKSEQAWEETQSTFTTEFFSLDLRVLESAVSCIPLQVQLEMNNTECDDSILARLREDAQNNRVIHLGGESKTPASAEDELSSKLINILSGKNTKPDKEEEKEFEDDLEKILGVSNLSNLSLSQPDPCPSSDPCQASIVAKEESKETKNLEDWLDDFLSD